MEPLGAELALSVRLVVAAALGAAIGLEPDLASHPAGIRTHLLVSLGSALFAVISAYGYADVFAADPNALNNPQPIAAQIVSGIGFLGAGAIIHAGRWVRGLTTAASTLGDCRCRAGRRLGRVRARRGRNWPDRVWSGTIESPGCALWRGNRSRLLRLRVELSSITGLGRVTALAVSSGAEVVGLESRKLGKGRYEVELALRLLGGHATSEIVSSIGALGGAEVIDASDTAE